MNRLAQLLFLILLPLMAWAQEADSSLYKGYYYNKEYDVYIRLDAYAPTVVIPNQPIYGELNGFLGDRQDGRKWLFTGVTVGERKIEIEIINDYGSEDLVAEFSQRRDGTFLLAQGQGATMKIARKGKWVKLPKNLVFEKKEEKR